MLYTITHKAIKTAVKKVMFDHFKSPKSPRLENVSLFEDDSWNLHLGIGLEGKFVDSFQGRVIQSGPNTFEVIVVSFTECEDGDRTSLDVLVRVKVIGELFEPEHHLLEADIQTLSHAK
jgi:hypothetical protein